MAQSIVSEDLITQAIEQHLQEAVEERLSAVVKEAQNKIEKELRSEISSIVMGLAKMYDVQFNKENVIITVKDFR